ncbi:MAG: ImmA/IrrE family metallo-endopeptidase [Tepidisphaeraceae bacterium]
MSIARRYTPAHVERRAAEVRQQCVAALHLYQVPLPIPVDEWVERPLGIDFSVVDLRPSWTPVSVVLGDAEPRQRRIRVHEEWTSDSQFRFTVAHELGHVILHQEDALFRDGSPEPAGRDPKEREADHFAYAFLMPVELVVREVFSVCMKEKIDPLRLVGSTAAAKRRHLAIWKRTVIPHLMKRFGVSRKVAICRLRHVDRETAEPFIPDRLREKLLKK